MMKIGLYCVAAAVVSAIPVALQPVVLKVTDNSENTVIAELAAICDPKACFGAHIPSAEHQQCMVAAPPFSLAQKSRSWQAGCWCTATIMSCDAFCDPINIEAIRVLYQDVDSGANEWLATTVATEIVFDAAIALEDKKGQTDEDLRQDCISGCQSRGACEGK